MPILYIDNLDQIDFSAVDYSSSSGQQHLRFGQLGGGITWVQSGSGYDVTIWLNASGGTQGEIRIEDPSHTLSQSDFLL